MHPGEDAQVQQTVIQFGVGEDRQAAAVETSVAHQHQLADHGLPVCLDRDGRLRLAHGLQAGEHVGELREALFGFPVHEADGPGIEARAGHLGEVTAAHSRGVRVVREGRVDPALIAVEDGLPRCAQSQRQTQLAREDVDRSQRQHGEPRARESLRHICDSVEHLVHRAISASSDQRVEPIAHRLGGETATVAGSLRGLERDPAGELGEVLAEVACLVAPRGGIEDDASAHGDAVWPTEG